MEVKEETATFKILAEIEVKDSIHIRSYEELYDKKQEKAAEMECKYQTTPEKLAAEDIKICTVQSVVVKE